MQTRTRTRTVVFTDMADYTRSVSASDREGLRNLLSNHQRLVEPVLTGRGGRIVKNIGDSFMALFDSATDAVRACVDLVEAHAPGGGSSVAFRAGIATGDVEETETDAFGEPVNMAARVISRTPTGEVWFASSTRHCMNQAEIAWESTGRHALKGIPGEVEIFRAVPVHAACLPDVLVAALKSRTLVRWQAGDPAPAVGPNAQVLLEGFRPGSAALAEAVDRLPMVDPSHLWLATYNVAPLDRYEWIRAGRGLVVGTPMAIRAAIVQHERASTRASGSDTIILDGGTASAVDLVVAGLALPAVPLAEVVAGYSYDLLPDGRWLNRSERAILRVDVGAAGPTVTVLGPGVQVGTQVAPVNASFPLREGTAIRCAAGTLRYVPLHAEDYVGALVGDTQMRMGVGHGQEVMLGREPEHPGLLLPDRNNQDNIRWLGGPKATRAREKGFTLDKALTGRKQAGVVVQNGRPQVVAHHPTCPTLLVDGAATLTRVTTRRAADFGDLLLLGTTVVALRAPD